MSNEEILSLDQFESTRKLAGHEGLFRVTNSEGMGIFDNLNKRMVVPMKYRDIEPFKGNFFTIVDHGLMGLIELNLEHGYHTFRIPTEFASIEDLPGCEGIAVVTTNKTHPNNISGECVGLYTYSGGGEHLSFQGVRLISQTNGAGATFTLEVDFQVLLHM